MNASKVVTAPARGLKALSRMLFSRGGGLVWKLLPRTRFDYAREVGDGMGSSVVMSTVLWIARTFPEAPIQVLDDDGDEVERHDMVTRLRRPNRFYSGSVMWMAVIVSWVLDGNAYLLKVRNQVGGVLELWYVPHWLMEPISNDPEEFIEYYRYTPDGQALRVEIEDVVHLRYGLDPRNPRKGLSPLGSVLREVFTDDEAANFSASLLRNLGVPGLIVSPDPAAPPPSADDVEAVKEYVNHEARGDKRGAPLVMSGASRVDQFGFNPQQMTLRELRRIPEERVSSAIGVPAIVVGLGAGLDRSTFANMAEAREAAYEGCLIPTQRLMAEELWLQLLPDFEDDPDLFTVAFDLSNVRVLQDDRNEEATRLVALYKGGIITRAKALAELGEESTEADEVYLVAMSDMLVPVGATVTLPQDEPPPPEQPPPDEPPPEPPNDEEPPEPKANGNGLEPILKLAGGQTERGRRLLIAQHRIGGVLELVFGEELEADFAGLGDLVADAYRDQVVQQHGAEPDALKAPVDATTDADALASRVIVAAGVAEWGQKVLRPRFEAHYRRSIAETLRTLNRVADLGVLLPAQVEARIIHQGGTRAGLIDVPKQTRKAILRGIAEGRAADETAEQITERIREHVPAGNYRQATTRARTIARTETRFAQNAASMDAYRSSPVVTRVVAFDGSGNPDCAARNGQTYTFDEAEIEMALEHPNGTLDFAPVTVDVVIQSAF